MTRPEESDAGNSGALPFEKPEDRISQVQALISAAGSCREQGNWLWFGEPPPKDLDTQTFIKSLAFEILNTLHRDENQVRSAFGTLRRIIETGNENGIWSLCVPSEPVRIKRDATGFSPDRFARVPRFRAMTKIVHEALATFPTLTPEHQVGAFFCAAILQGGILSKPLVAALSQALGTPLIRVGPLPFLDLSLKQLDSANVRRWFPPLACELLYLNLTPEAVSLAGGKPPSDICEHIKEFLRSTGMTRQTMPSHLGDLLADAVAGASLKLPGLIREYALNPDSSSSLHHHALLRLWQRRGSTLTRAPGAAQESPIESDREDSTDEADPGYSVPQDDQWLRAIYVALRRGQHQPDAIRELGEVVTAEQALPAARIIAAWLVDRLGRNATPAIKVTSAYALLSTVGKRIYGLSGNEDPSRFTQDEYTQLYNDVLECAGTSAHREKLRKGCRNFHQFLAHSLDAPPVSLISTLGGTADTAYVDANLISFDEYEAILAALQRLPVSQELAETASLLLILAFRCGFRRNELIKLRIVDLLGNRKPEILVRPFPGRTLKTANATRRVPIHALLSATELQRLLAWRERREQDQAEGCDSPFLFKLPESRQPFINEELVIPLIQRVMRETTGDGSLHFHHFRHSCASWLLLALAHADHPLDHFTALPLTDQWLRQATELRARLYELPELCSPAPRRRHAFLVAHLLGHSSPDMTLKHYSHWLDLMLFTAFQTRPSDLPVGTLAALLNRNPDTIYKHRAAGTLDSQIGSMYRKSPLGLEPPIVDRDRHVVVAIDNAPVTSLFERLSTAWRILFHANVNGLGLDVLVDRFSLGERDITTLLDRADELANMRSRPDLFRHRMIEHPDSDGSPKRISCPPGLRKSSETEVARWLCDAIDAGDPKESAWALDYYIEQIGQQRNHLVFREFGSAKRYLAWLRSLGIPVASIQLTHLKGDMSAGKARTALKAWRTELALARSTPTKQDLFANRSLGEFGWFAIQIDRFPGSKTSDGNYGFRFVLTTRWIHRPLDKLLIARRAQPGQPTMMLSEQLSLF